MAEANIPARLASRLKKESREAFSLDLRPRALSHTFQLAAANFLDNDDPLWASALTYTSTLSLVPVLVLAFSAAKTVAGLQQIQPLLAHYLALDSPAINEKLTALIAHTNAAALGTVGAVTLVITDITTLGTIERAFNHIWRVPRGRSYLRKFTDYLSVTFTVPVLLAVALGLSARFVKHSPVPGLSSILPFLLVWPGFLFLFVFFSYTRVRWGPALLGSLVTAVLWQAAQWGYIHFQVRAGAYQAIYGALAAIPILLLWLYISWGIVLFGVEVTAAAQHGAALLGSGRQTLGLMRAAALMAMVRLGQRARDPGRVLTADGLARELGLDHNTLGPMLERLKHSGLVVEAQVEHLGRPGGLFLAREAATLRLDEILESVCGADDLGAAGGEPRIGEVLARLARLEGELLRSMTLSDLLGAPEVAAHKHA